MTELSFLDLTGQGVVHFLTILKVLFVRLATVIVVRKYLGRLPEQFQVVSPSTIRTGYRTYIKWGNLTRKVSVGVAGGKIDNDPILQIGTLVGIKGIGILQRTGMMFEDHDISVFHNVTTFHFSHNEHVQVTL
jgi:hypothetical protein